MRKIGIISFFLVESLIANTQLPFKTVIPNLPVVAGESFQVQYILERSSTITDFKAPAFNHFRFVSGPNWYNGSVNSQAGIQPIKNIVYTLEAISPGRFTIKGAFALVNGKPVKSNDVVLEVIPKKEGKKLPDSQVNTNYFLKPGEDPYRKISENLFLKLSVDRKICYVGEPVLANFKLYSRLESSSDIVKNPGFYGFAMVDMVNLSDKEMHRELVNGKLFDVHTVRKVQLYPLQAGTYTIDAMEIKNQVEFSRIRANKRTDQQITEGVLNEPFPRVGNESTELYETSMRNYPVVIRVLPIPVKNVPVTFSGAVGNFTISAPAIKGKLAKNEEGVFDIIISGQGNFIQLNAPSIKWPEGIEGFEPAILDSLDKTNMPVSGSRTFRFPFVSSHPGIYQVPAINFSFFDPQKREYETISTVSATVEIGKEEKKNVIRVNGKESISEKNARASRIAAGIISLLLVLVITYWILQKNKAGATGKPAEAGPATGEDPLMPEMNLQTITEKEFCRKLYAYIWKNIEKRYGLKGSTGNKKILFIKLRQEGLGEEFIARLEKILSACEIGIFTSASLDTDKEKMLVETRELLGKFNPGPDS